MRERRTGDGGPGTGAGRGKGEEGGGKAKGAFWLTSFCPVRTFDGGDPDSPTGFKIKWGTIANRILFGKMGKTEKMSTVKQRRNLLN
jgi:hypothetical protein